MKNRAKSLKRAVVDSLKAVNVNEKVSQALMNF